MAKFKVNRREINNPLTVFQSLEGTMSLFSKALSMGAVPASKVLTNAFGKRAGVADEFLFITAIGENRTVRRVYDDLSMSLSRESIRPHEMLELANSGDLPPELMGYRHPDAS